MDTKIGIKINLEEKKKLQDVAQSLEITVTELVKRKVFGKSLIEEYIKLVSDELKDLEKNEIFTIKEILEEAWEILSKGDKEYLSEIILEKSKQKNFDIKLYKITKKNKYKFEKL